MISLNAIIFSNYMITVKTAAVKLIYVHIKWYSSPPRALGRPPVAEAGHFPNSLQPIPCMQESNSSDLISECTVTLIGWQFSVQPIAAQCWRGRIRKILEILEKNAIFNEHPVLLDIRHLIDVGY